MFNNGFPPNLPGVDTVSTLAKLFQSGSPKMDVRACWNQQIQCTQCSRMFNNGFPPNLPGVDTVSTIAKGFQSGSPKMNVRIDRIRSGSTQRMTRTYMSTTILNFEIYE